MLNSVYELNKENFKDLFPNIPHFRFNQIEHWRSLGLNTFSEYKNLGKSTIDELKAKCKVFSSKVIKTQEAFDSTKFLIELEDGNLIECVAMQDEKKKRTVCLSSQVGCACGCKFCATGTLGFTRNLKSYEIIEQFYHIKSHFLVIDNIVFMGMGEPLLNIDSVVKSIEYFKQNEKISARRITLSTSGIAKGIMTLAEKKTGIKLTLSLVVANQEKRAEIMNVAKENTLSKLKEALLYFQHNDNRRITLAYCMLQGINMDRKSTLELKNFAKGLVYHINLIPWNKVDFLEYNAPLDSEIRDFERELKKEKIPYSIRYSKGSTINAACGQLVAKNTSN